MAPTMRFPAPAAREKVRRREVPVSDARIWRKDRATGETSPLVRAALAVINHDRHAAVEGLEDWYQAHTFRTFSEWSGLGFTNPAVENAPPWAVPMPWWNETMEKRRSRALATIVAETGCEPTSDEEATRLWPNAGPATREDVQREIGRIEAVLENWGQIVGTQTLDSLPQVRRLEISDSNACIWEVKSGNHRVACAGALAVPTLLCVEIEAVSAASVSDWLGVKSGLFTPPEALSLFELVASGNPGSLDG